VFEVSHKSKENRRQNTGARIHETEYKKQDTGEIRERQEEVPKKKNPKA
jgi:hypothetical protein